eukprot:c17281_g1_i1.p1 GENE.c17281_g1_i1~~c17281_g1_i1.p1  ORF type:complete len:653 (-),score=234.15 c17281_g1_i1:103-2061(-)
MPSIFSKLSYLGGPNLVPGLFSVIFLVSYYIRRQKFLKKLQKSESQRSLADLEAIKRASDVKKLKKKNAQISDIIPVLKFAFGKRELMNLSALTVCLLARTYLTVWIANQFGTSMKQFCDKQWKKLFAGTQVFASWTFMAACVNGFLKYLQALLATNMRHRLTSTAHTLYMQRMNYYRANKVGDDKFENIDQMISDDINKFTDEFADCYCNVLKPVVDVVMFTYELYKNVGSQGLIGMYGWFAISAYLSTLVLPPYGRLSAEEQVLEGRFRAAHAELIQNGEMVAFFRGEVPEKKVLDRAFYNIRKHVLSVQEMKLPCDIIQGYVNKYLASVVGFAVVVRPVYYNFNGKGTMTAGEIAKYFVNVRQILEGLATSVLALFELQKKVGSLTGLGDRLNNLYSGLLKRQPILQKEMELYKNSNPPKIVPGKTLKFENVSVYRPDGTLLIHNLNMEVRPGERVMITGDNGCGKSSLFRVLCGLWPMVCGTITSPPAKDIFFLSQVNFVPIGTLRDLVIYPQTLEQMRASGRNDENVLQALRWSHLEDLQCENIKPTLNDQLDWGTALSPGQKQRVAFARLLYHCPQYAILDECTNGISPDVERDLYNRCQKLGMAVFSISHKVELKQLHDLELHINHDAQGSYKISQIEKQTTESH